MAEKKKFSIPQGYRTPLILLLCIGIGAALGWIFGEKILWIKPFGTIFVNLCFTVSVPTVLFSITSSVAQITSLSRLGKILRNTLIVFFITGIFAGTLMIIWCHIVPPGKGIENLVAIGDSSITEFDLGDRIASTLTVSDFPDLFSKSHILPLIIACIMVGIFISQAGEKAKGVIEMFDVFNDVCMKIVGFIMKYIAPIGLLAYFATLVADLGPQIMGTYARVTLKIYYPVAIVYFLFSNFFYTLFAGGMEAVKKYFKKIFPVAITAFGTQSSLATLPSNIQAAKEIGVPKDVRSVVMPLGATAHMDGAVMSNMLKIAMLFALSGLPFSGLLTYVEAILICTFCGVVTSAIPGSGMIGAVIIMGFFGFSQEYFPIIASLTFFVDPFSTAINCTGDCTTSMIVTRLLEGKDWMKRNLTANESES